MTTHPDDIFFCETMISHYAEQYKNRMHGWQFKKAVFAWKRWQFYKSVLLESSQQLQSVLTEINNQHERPAITVTG